jgi:hypothetical protein
MQQQEMQQEILELLRQEQYKCNSKPQHAHWIIANALEQIVNVLPMPAFAHQMEIAYVLALVVLQNPSHQHAIQ